MPTRDTCLSVRIHVYSAVRRPWLAVISRGRIKGVTIRNRRVQLESGPLDGTSVRVEAIDCTIDTFSSLRPVSNKTATIIT